VKRPWQWHGSGLNYEKTAIYCMSSNAKNTVLKSRGVVFDFSCSFEDSSTLILVFKILVVAVASWATETLSSFVPSHHLSNTATSTKIEYQQQQSTVRPTSEVVGAIINPTTTAIDELATVRPLSARRNARRRVFSARMNDLNCHQRHHHNVAGAPRVCSSMIRPMEAFIYVVPANAQRILCSCVYMNPPYYQPWSQRMMNFHVRFVGRHNVHHYCIAMVYNSCHSIM